MRFLVRILFLACWWLPSQCWWLPSHCVFMWERERACSPSFYEDTYLTSFTNSFNLNYLLTVQSQIQSHWGLGFHHTNSGRTQFIPLGSLHMQILEPHLRPSETETRGLELSNLCVINVLGYSNACWSLRSTCLQGKKIPAPQQNTPCNPQHLPPCPQFLWCIFQPYFFLLLLNSAFAELLLTMTRTITHILSSRL